MLCYAMQATVSLQRGNELQETDRPTDEESGVEWEVSGRRSRDRKTKLA